MKSPLQILRASTDFSIAAQLDLPGRKERLLPIPELYSTGDTRRWLEATTGVAQLRAHQSQALQHVAEGRNVVISTGTASGKSLVFQTAVIHELLTSGGRALVLYPSKALLSDQHAHWRVALVRAGLNPDLVMGVYGGVSSEDRAKLLDTARIIVATPDVIQAWLLRQVASPAVRSLLADLRFLVLDEAHAYEDVLGSTSAFLLRRLRAAQLRVLEGASPMQIVAATATIADPASHLENLTGLTFEEVGEDANGAPCHARSILHLEGPDAGGPAEKMIADIIGRLADEIGEGSFIAFHDSRQGVERICKLVDRADVLPYRGGYVPEDRAAIERSLREGTLKGVVSTSALELGIDIRQFVIGFNIGVPRSRKSFRQRLGRVGRSSPGLFAIIAPRLAFAKFGSSLREFHEASVEPSHLYLENSYIQFTQARCLAEECELTGVEPSLPGAVRWPAGFDRAFALALPDADRPRDLQQLYAAGASNPHLHYPLRNICTSSYALKVGKGSGADLETMTEQQALREAYPGATYLHQRRPHKVREWRSTSYEKTIRLDPVSGAGPTFPILSTQVNASFEADEVVERHLLKSDQGALAEVHLQVTEAVEGFRSGGASMLYSDLRRKDPRMHRQVRSFTTTGIVIQIEEDWFSGADKPQVEVRRSVATALKQVLARDHSISPGDVDYAVSRIAIYGPAGPRRVDNAIVLYDSTEGSLRLTEPLFSSFEPMIERLVAGAGMAGEDALLSEAAAERLSAWHGRLSPSLGINRRIPTVGEGEYKIYAPGSEVEVIVGGKLVQRRLIEPKLWKLDDTEILLYRYEDLPGVDSMVAHEKVQAIGQNWRMAIWSPVTGVIREMEL